MKSTSTKSLRLLAAIAVSATLMTGFTSSVLAHPGAPATEAQQQEWAKHRQEHIKARLAKVAQRLEIKASQQGAWQAYAQTIETIGATAWKKPAPGTQPDAATMIRHRADRASEHARKLAQIADATAKLQEVLSPEQRKTFDQIVMHAEHRGHRWGQRHHGGGSGPHEQPGHGPQGRG